MNKIEERDMRKYIELNKKDNFITELHEELIRERQIINEKIKEIERLNKELKIKTDFIEELLYIILNSTDNKLQKEVHRIGIKYDKNIQELKGDGSNEKDTNE